MTRDVGGRPSALEEYFEFREGGGGAELPRVVEAAETRLKNGKIAYSVQCRLLMTLGEEEESGRGGWDGTQQWFWPPKGNSGAPRTEGSRCRTAVPTRTAHLRFGGLPQSVFGIGEPVIGVRQLHVLTLQ